MYLLEPIIHETIWGGDRLKKYRDYDGKIGHLYLAAGHEDITNVILNGKDKGKTLCEAFEQYKDMWGLGEFEEFPLTIALVDATNDLSIQVHPDDAAALELEGVHAGKTESWIFLETPKTGWIYGGSNCSSKEEIVNAIEENKMDEITAHFEVEPMECVTVGAGTLHSMAGGSLVYEIEFGSNITYRFYDFNRLDANGNSRELHIDKAVRSVDPCSSPIKEKVEIDQPLNEGVYQVRYMENISKYTNESNEIQILTVLSGTGEVEEVPFKSGMSIVLFPSENITNLEIEKMIVAELVR